MQRPPAEFQIATRMPGAVWRLATYGGAPDVDDPVDDEMRISTAPGDSVSALNRALALSQRTGTWIVRDGKGNARAAALAEWRSLVPSLVLRRIGAPIRDRTTGVEADMVAGALHAARATPLPPAVTLCNNGLEVARSHGRIQNVPVPAHGETLWCAGCLVEMAELIDHAGSGLGQP